MKVAFLSLLFLSAASELLIAQNAASLLSSSLDRAYFIENKGQWPAEVLFLHRTGGMEVWITRSGMNITCYQPGTAADGERTQVNAHRVLLQYAGGKPSPAREGREPMEAYFNYLAGQDPGRQATHVRLFKEALIKNVYEGIDIRYYFDEGRLRFDYLVAAHADASRIRFTIRGAECSRSDGTGNLLMHTGRGRIELAGLKTLQEGKVIPSRFESVGNEWSVALGAHDPAKPLVIDPLLFSTYIGGSSGDECRALEVDAVGDIYIAGFSQSANYDTTAGVVLTSLQPMTDGIVTKLNAAGNALLFSTFFGGSGSDQAKGIAVNSNGEVFVTGQTNSTNFNVPAGGSAQTLAGNLDAFVMKLSNDGTVLLYSTLLGSPGLDRGTCITVNGNDEAIVAGETQSAGFPVTAGAFNQMHSGSSDIFVAKLNAGGSSLIFSTYIGGNSVDLPESIELNSTGSIYLCGSTSSPTFPVSNNAYQTTFGGQVDAFMLILDSSGSQVVHSTFFGINNVQTFNDLAVDAAGSVYGAGYTSTSAIVTTPGVWQPAATGSGDGFAVRFNQDLSALLFAALNGGSGQDEIDEIEISASGAVYLAGRTGSTDLDITPNAFQPSPSSGQFEIYLLRLNADATALDYSTYLGGSANEFLYGMELQPSGDLTLGGATFSTDFDVTAGAFQTMHEGGGEIFVTRFESCTIPIGIGYTSQPGLNVCAGSTVTLSGTGGSNFSWSGGIVDGVPFTAASTTTYTLIGEDAGSCPDTLQVMLTVTPLPDTGVSFAAPVLSALQSGAAWQWVECPAYTPVAGATNQSFTPAADGAYAVIVTLNGCTDTSSCWFIQTVSGEGAWQTGWTVYPNPNQGRFIAEVSQETLLSLSDLSGRELAAFALTRGRNEIQISLPAGMYLLRDTRSGQTQRLLVE